MSEHLALVAQSSLLRTSEPVRIGMPHLCRAGLSENWLWKAAGHEHWLALAEAHDLAAPDFRTTEGERLYPAFTRVALADGRLETAAEGETLSFALRLEHLTRTRFASEISVHAGARLVARMTMETAFVRRTVAGANTSAARAMPAAPCWLPRMGGRAPSRSAGMGPAIRRHVVDSNPHEDFNGADFLYFASFQAIVDRAEWAWFRQAEPLATTRAREIRYFGNIELGDRIEVALCGGDARGHRCELRRKSDGALIAEAVTERR